MPGAHRTRSLARRVKKRTSVVTTGTPKHSGIPRAMVLRLASGTIPAQCVALLRVDISVEMSGPHDFAVRRHVVRLVDIAASIASRANES
jgi:hypothetical protein